MPQRYYVEKSMNPYDVSVEYPVDYDGMVIVPPNMVGTLAAPSKAKADSFNDAFKRIMHSDTPPAISNLKQSARTALTPMFRIRSGRWG